MRQLWIVLVLIATALTFYSALWFKSESIEADIRERVTEEMGKTDAKDIEIGVDGRHVTLTGVVNNTEAESRYLDVADKTYGALGPIDGLTYSENRGFVTAVKTADGVVLNGSVPDAATRDELIELAAKATSGSVTDNLDIDGDRGAWHDEAGFGLGQLARLATGSVTAAGGAYMLSGTAAADAGDVQGDVSRRNGWSSFVSAPDASSVLNSEISRLQGEVDLRDGQITDLTAQVAAKDADLSQANSGLAGKLAALEAVRGTLLTRDSEVTDLSAQLQAAQAAQATAEQEATGKAMALADVRDNLAGVSDQRAELQSKLGVLTQERDALTDELARLRDGMSQEQAETADLSGELSAAKANIAALQDERDASVAALTSDLTARDAMIADKEAELAALTGEVGTLKDEVARLSQDTSSQVQDLQAALSAEQSTSADLSAQVSDLTAQLSDKTAMADALSSDVADKSAMASDLEAQLAEKSAMAADLQAQLDAQTAMASSLKGEVAEKVASAAALTALVADKTAMADALGADVTARDGTIADLEAKLAALDSTVAARDADLAERNGIIAERDATIAALQNQSSNTTSFADQCASRASAVLEGSKINFGTGNANISGESAALLERLTGIALACVNEDVALEIGGHTDSQGSDADNAALSERRAAAVLAFMTERGVPASGIAAKGYGEAQPIADNATAAGRAENRRITFDWQAR